MDTLKKEYVIIRSARRSLSLSVNGAGEVVVRAPKAASRAQIERFVAGHADWIARRRAEIAAARPDLSDGAYLTVCGRRCRIAPGARASLRKDVLILPEEGREQALIALLKREARRRMGELVAWYASEYGFRYRKLRITSARGRWGSCSTQGDLSFSFRAALLDDAQMRYLAVHELCHTRHMDHGKAFWDEVRSILPDCMRTRAQLREKGALMLFL